MRVAQKSAIISINMSDSVISTEILQTKIRVPPLPVFHVPRPRLVENLQDAKGFLLISAPAGFGKTTMCAELVHRLQYPCAWLSLDRQDNNVGRFLKHVIAAVQVARPGFGESLASRIDRIGNDLVDESAIIALINFLCEMDEDICLVLEDYHAVSDQRIHSVVSYLIGNMPANLLLVMVTRSDPPFALSQHRAGGRMLEYRGQHLSFTDEEALSLLRDGMNLPIDERGIVALTEKTEGWAAGLQLAGLSLSNLAADQIEKFVEDFSGTERYVLDYLLDEVLSKQPPAIQDFLAKTSILDRLCPELCECIVNNGDGPVETREVIDYLESTNLFFVPLDSERRWFRYHHLFADLLRRRIQSDARFKVSELHRSASIWFEARGRLSEAIAHAALSEDTELLADQTERSFFDRMGHGEDFSTMFARLASIPAEVTSRRPHLSVQYAWMLLIALRVGEVPRWIETVKAMPPDKITKPLALHLDIIEGGLARYRGNRTAAIELLESALETAGDMEHRDPVVMQVITGATQLLAWAYYDRGYVRQAKDKFRQSVEIGRAAESIAMTLISYRGLALSILYGGDAKSAYETGQKAMSYLNESSDRMQKPPTSAAFAYVTMAEILRHRNELDQAVGFIRSALDSVSEFDAETVRDIYLEEAYCLTALGNYADAETSVRKAADLANEHKDIGTFDAPIGVCRTYVSAMRPGNNTQKPAEAVSPEDTSLFGTELQILQAYELVTHNSAAPAIELLTRLETETDMAGRGLHGIQIRLLKAVAYDMLDHAAMSSKVLEAALMEVSAGGCIRALIDFGDLIAPLLPRLQPANSIARFAAELLPAPIYASPDSADALSEREYEVLRLMAKNMTTQDIAKEIFVSVNTVKTHMKSIYSKLDAHSRYEALSKAKEQHLIG